MLRRGGTSKGGDDVRRRGEGIGETSVLEMRSVRSNDIDGEDHTYETDRVEHLYIWSVLCLSCSKYKVETHLRSTIHINVLTCGTKDQTDSREKSHEGETIGSVPQVEGLGEGHVGGCAHDVGNDADGGNKRVGREVRDDVGGQVTGYGGLESVNKVQKKHAALVVKVILID